MNKILKTFGAATLVAASALTFSTSSQAAGDNINAFADCGIGAGIFDNDTAAIISNVIWDLGTTALTSKLSSPETCDGGDDSVTAAKFIYESYVNLEDDTAKGEGEHLNAMLSILGCESNENALMNIRKDFAIQVSNDNYGSESKLEKSKAYFNSVVSHCDSAA